MALVKFMRCQMELVHCVASIHPPGTHDFEVRCAKCVQAFAQQISCANIHIDQLNELLDINMKSPMSIEHKTMCTDLANKKSIESQQSAAFVATGKSQTHDFFHNYLRESDWAVLDGLNEPQKLSRLAWHAHSMHLENPNEKTCAKIAQLALLRHSRQEDSLMMLTPDRCVKAKRNFKALMDKFENTQSSKLGCYPESPEDFNIVSPESYTRAFVMEPPVACKYSCATMRFLVASVAC